MAVSFLNKNIRKRIIRYVFIAIVLLPLWMFLAWVISSKRKMVVAIIDKTVLTTNGQEHLSLNWILNYQKFAKNNFELYDRSKDYYGFFPLPDYRYRLKGLERFTSQQLQQLSADADMAYITDAYGIYHNEWYHVKDDKERSQVVYGGMSEQDIEYLKLMQQKHKMVIAEFNCLGSPTSASVRSEFETAFGVKWSGWIGRYFDSLDTTVNLELPKWLIRNYKAQHNNKWPFNKSGIAYVRNDDHVEVLQYGDHLNRDIPFIYSNEEGQNYYGLASAIKYSYWFEISAFNRAYNHSIADLEVDANDAGRKILNAYHIPERFPVITVHINKDYRFFYFAADFCDNPIGFNTSYFKGVQYFTWLFYNSSDAQERVSFFWKIYRPMMTRILNDYYGTLKQ